jgi:RHS repeat-associated protein
VRKIREVHDENGNMTSRGGSGISWYSYNQPNRINAGAYYSEFSYNANHQRWKQVATDASGTTTTRYIGGILEKLDRLGGVTEYRHMIPAGSGTAIYMRKPDGTNATTYLTTDHLGSGDLVLDSSGNVLAKMSFSPFGARRGSNWQGTPSSADYTTFSNKTNRGFTGHEMLDAIGLVNMNGRVYDPLIGRFLSADPIIQTIELSQALNPYSYVMNMPLTLIDPSGYSWLSKLFSSIGKFFKKFWRPILAIVLAAITYGALSSYFAVAQYTFAEHVVAYAITGAVAGGVMGGVKGAITGFLSGALFGGIAAFYGESWTVGRIALNGLAGGVSSAISGGDFLQGAALSLALSGGQWAAQRMREAMWKQSQLNPDNASGKSEGWRGDGHKLAGGRVNPNSDGIASKLFKKLGIKGDIFGGEQGGEGRFFGDTYAPGSLRDHLMEAYAGPHDWLSSNWYSNVTGNLVKMNWFERQLFSIQSFAALVPATAIVGADVVPGMAYSRRW